MANYKRQYATLYHLKQRYSQIVRRDFDVNHGYIRGIYLNHNPLSEFLMLWSIRRAKIPHYQLRLIIHMGKQTL